MKFSIPRRIDEDEIWFAAAGGHDAYFSIPENFIQYSLAVLEAIDLIEQHACIAAEKDSMVGDDTEILNAVAPAFHT